MQQTIDKAPANYTATQSHMIGTLDSWNSLATMISHWHTHMVPVRHPEDGPGIGQIGHIISKFTMEVDASHSV